MLCQYQSLCQYEDTKANIRGVRANLNIGANIKVYANDNVKVKGNANRKANKYVFQHWWAYENISDAPTLQQHCKFLTNSATTL